MELRDEIGLKGDLYILIHEQWGGRQHFRSENVRMELDFWKSATVTLSAVWPRARRYRQEEWRCGLACGRRNAKLGSGQLLLDTSTCEGLSHPAKFS